MVISMNYFFEFKMLEKDFKFVIRLYADWETANLKSAHKTIINFEAFKFRNELVVLW